LLFDRRSVQIVRLDYREVPRRRLTPLAVRIVLNAGDMGDKGKAIGRISCDRMRSDWRPPRRGCQVRTRLSAGGRWIGTLRPPSEGQRFSRLLFPTMRARHRRLPKCSPPRPAAAPSSCRSRSDERRTHSPTRRSSGPPDRRHHHPFALITALCFFRVRFISCSCAVALSRGRAPP
jgi:hypothetical protein